MDADVIVAGGGVMGSATALALARDGREVLLLERFEIGHTRGSSHGASRIFRFSYRDPVYVRMVREVLPLWRTLEEETGETFLTVTGGLDTGVGLDDHARALRECHVPFETLEGDVLRERFPFANFEGRVLFQPDAGVLAAERAWRAMAGSAARAGASVREGVRVIALQADGDGVTVRTEDGELRTRVAVVTAGAWARDLLATVGIDLPVRPTRETVGYFRIDEDVPVPALVDWGDPAVYSLPTPGHGIKAGRHRAGPTVDPDDDGGADEGSLRRLRDWVRQRFPAAEPEPHLVETCLYTNTADQEFILDRRGPIVIGSPCSGHGFKFAPLVGRRLAALANLG